MNSDNQHWGAKLLCNNHLCVIHWDEHRDREWNSSQATAPSSFTDLFQSATLIYKAKNLNTFFLFFFNQEHNLQIQAILTSECGEVKACTCPTISQNEILHQEQASGKIYRDRQNDAGFKPKNGFLFQGVKERH